jgi:hypothetical protein
VIDGVLLRLWLFVMRLPCSGAAFAVAFANQAPEAFFEGHVLGSLILVVCLPGCAMTTSNRR